MTNDRDVQSADFKINSFEKTLRNMRCVEAFIRDGHLYRIERKVGKAIVVYLTAEVIKVDDRAIHVDMYTIGQNDVTEIVDKCGHDIDCIVTLSDYNEYTSNAKAAAELFGIRLSTAQELFKDLADPNWP